MITFATAPLTTTFFVAIRLGTLVLLSPIEAIRQLPVHARLLLVLVLSVLMVANLPSPTRTWDETALVMSGLAELGNGLILSLSLSATFAIFQIAGQLIDTQMGLNSLAILNPTDHSHDPLSSRLLLMLAVLFFFALNGHHKLLQGLVLSLSLIPPGQLILFEGFSPVIKQFTLMFSLAFMIASPIVFSLIMVDLFGAVLTRNMPQINTYFLTLPIKILLGTAMFFLLLSWANPLMDKVFYLLFQSLKSVIT